MATRNTTTQSADLDAYEELVSKLRHARSIADALTAVDKDETDVNGIGYALEQMLGDALAMLDDIQPNLVETLAPDKSGNDSVDVDAGSSGGFELGLLGFDREKISDAVTLTGDICAIGDLLVGAGHSTGHEFDDDTLTQTGWLLMRLCRNLQDDLEPDSFVRAAAT